jgi:membrane protease YdiL (CAAX protease family)
MKGSRDRETRHENPIRRYPITSYFLITFAISWAAAFALAAPAVLRGRAMNPSTGILMFPVMLLGPLVGGIVMSRVSDGQDGVRNLFRRVFLWRVSARWYAALLIPPAGVFLILYVLQHFVSAALGPNNFWLGIAFGVPAGICEEIGWTGFAFPKMRAQRSSLAAAIILGLLWAAWHLPVISYLGASAPHRHYWGQFLAAFALAMTAMRVLIAWLYTNTGSVLMAQLLHISSTGALVIFSPAVTPYREAMWYALYGCLLWGIVAIIVGASGRQLRTEH